MPEQNIINSNNLNFENDEKKQNNETFDENLSLNTLQFILIMPTTLI